MQGVDYLKHSIDKTLFETEKQVIYTLKSYIQYIHDRQLERNLKLTKVLGLQPTKLENSANIIEPDYIFRKTSPTGDTIVMHRWIRH